MSGKARSDIPEDWPADQANSVGWPMMQSEAPGGAANEITDQHGGGSMIRSNTRSQGEYRFKAGISLNILDLIRQGQIKSLSIELLQEYFAARRLAASPKTGTCPSGVATRAGRTAVRGGHQRRRAAREPVPPLRQTGWEETVVTAAPMADDPVELYPEPDPASSSAGGPLCRLG
jgi:hypothetical protein